MLRNATKRVPSPVVSFVSFVLGFLVACILSYSMCNTGVWLTLCASIRTCTKDPPLSKDLIYDEFRSPISDHNTHPFCPEKIRLLIIIPSGPNGIVERNAIRYTWLRNCNSSGVIVTAKFVVGSYNLNRESLQSLTNEQKKYRDLLIFNDLQDSYWNLTVKVKLALTWAYEIVKNFDFILKVDDDSFVRVDKLITALREMNCEKRLYWGYFMGRAPPEPIGKWAETQWHMCRHYLPYAMGGGYVLSKHVVKMLLRLSDRLKHYNNEDVTVGSWLAPYRLVRKHDIRFDVESFSHGCNNNYVISHKQQVPDIYEKFANLNSKGTLCSFEVETKAAYMYNWSTLPVYCCERISGLPVPPS